MPTPEIQFTECTSSLIHSHGHDAATNTLALRFRKKDGPGDTFHYANVSKEMYDTLTKSESMGKHFIEHIRGNSEKHPHTKI